MSMFICQYYRVVISMVCMDALFLSLSLASFFHPFFMSQNATDSAVCLPVDKCLSTLDEPLDDSTSAPKLEP